MPVGEGGMHQAEAEEMAQSHAEGKENTPAETENEEDDDKSAKKVQRKGKDVAGPVHGAMDDWKEDIMELAASQGAKRRKKKITEKLEMDEKGYMVKRMVEEWVTDDENDPPVVAKPTPSLSFHPRKEGCPSDEGGCGTEISMDSWEK